MDPGDQSDLYRGKEGRSVSLLSFHSLRHSFNSAMANAGVAPEIRQLLTGHASAEMNKVYTHHELETVRGAVESISRLPSKASDTPPMKKRSAEKKRTDGPR
ncbi:MAG: tyrosine-type recombinase/integrase [Verrucomicrobia bacterium]|nr:tyrosine-type recombinase/integrase [Verrucomicrobiota bacterium]